jgi:phospholipase/lecithinase/hemolysin
MKKQALAAGFVLLSCMLPVKANAANISHIYAFGDSLVDNGNAFQLTKPATGGIPPFPYFQGRFSNGPVWVEYLTDSLGIQATNYAVGGATTGSKNTLILNNPLGLPGLTQQIQGFLGANQAADQDALYIIGAGANDYLAAGVQDFTQPVSNLAAVVTSLASVGAKNFLVANLPDLGNLPGTRNSPFAGGLTALSGFHNSALSQTLNALSQQQPSLSIKLLDVYSLVERSLKDPSEFGFTNTTDACLNSIGVICSHPDDYLLWDGIHPTTRTHSIVAGAALVAVPEPSIALGLLAFGALGVTGLRKRKHNILKLTNPVLVAQSSHTKAEN